MAGGIHRLHAAPLSPPVAVLGGGERRHVADLTATAVVRTGAPRPPEACSPVPPPPETSASARGRPVRVRPMPTDVARGDPAPRAALYHHDPAHDASRSGPPTRGATHACALRPPRSRWSERRWRRGFPIVPWRSRRPDDRNRHAHEGHTPPGSRPPALTSPREGRMVKGRQRLYRPAWKHAMTRIAIPPVQSVLR